MLCPFRSLSLSTFSRFFPSSHSAYSYFHQLCFSVYLARVNIFFHFPYFHFERPLSALILGLSTHNLGDVCVFTVSCLCEVCPSARCASTASAILQSLVYFEIKMSPVIRLYVSLCTSLYRHYSFISGVIVLILTTIM